MKRLIPVVLLAACSVGESGIAPPLDRVFLPSLAKVDASSDWLFVVNSNLDLRFNAGTVTALDLRAVAADRNGTWPLCPPGRTLLRGTPERFCCHDPLDPRVLVCDERGYVQKDQTVRIGSFGVDMVTQPFVRNGVPQERLFIGVRSDPSITFIDTTVGAGGIQMKCSGRLSDPAPPEMNAQCEGDYLLTEGVAAPAIDLSMAPGAFRLSEEPYTLTLDPGLGVLYVGHLTSTSTISSTGEAISGVSLVDVCAPERDRRPALVSFTRFAFGIGGQSLGVTRLVPVRPGVADEPVYATARFSADIGEMFLHGDTATPCVSPAVAPGRNLHLVSTRSVLSTALFPRGADLRGLILQPEQNRAFALHYNSNGTGAQLESAAALVLLDTSPDAFGKPRFAPLRTIELGGAPVSMVMHDAGRGPRIYIVCFDAGQIWVVDPDLLEVSAIIDVGRGPSSIDFPAAQPDVAYVANFADNNIAIVDLTPDSPSENQVIQRIGHPRDAAANAAFR